MTEEKLTPEEQEEMEALREMLGVGIPKPDEKHNIFTTFSRIIRTKDTSKVSNLDEIELPAVRLLQDVANDLGYAYPDLKKAKQLLRDKSEILLATALSKKGFLVKSLITQKKESHIRSKQAIDTGGKKGWKMRGKEKEQE